LGWCLPLTPMTTLLLQLLRSCWEAEGEKCMLQASWQYIYNCNFLTCCSPAAVYCGDQHRSYHGTTAQPDPKLVLSFTEWQKVRVLPTMAHDFLYINFAQFINHHTVRKPSTAAPVRHNRLLTMAPPKLEKRMSHKEKEFKQVTKCLRWRLAWRNCTGLSYNPSVEQFPCFPWAISKENGYPHKGTKSSWTDKLSKCYNSAHLPVIMNTLP